MNIDLMVPLLVMSNALVVTGLTLLLPASKRKGWGKALCGIAAVYFTVALLVM